MKYVLFLAIGIVIGSCIGIVMMCMLQINTGHKSAKSNDLSDDEKKQQEEISYKSK